MENFYENNEIKDFEVKIFATGDCHSFIPMSFVKIQEKMCVTYYTEGYRQLNLEQLKNPCEILNIVEKLVLAMKAAQNHFIIQSRYSLKQEYIYVDQNMSNIKIQFIPIREKQNTSIFSEKIIIFLKELSFEDVSCCDYINMVIEKLNNVNLSMESLINYLGELKREAYLCGWG
ncbi:DUF6382 domain-containing protein [Aminipila sp.]|uniref:DUF6382 domain-containing protein n=1 Tax=Aminipila sp. TaxID=2060095 RepID=UPI00289E6260|nr:DUF6382 domain-containing protein [Aminipila sp.]